MEAASTAMEFHITERAQGELAKLVATSPEKALRIYFDGFG